MERSAATKDGGGADARAEVRGPYAAAGADKGSKGSGAGLTGGKPEGGGPSGAERYAEQTRLRPKRKRVNAGALRHRAANGEKQSAGKERRAGGKLSGTK